MTAREVLYMSIAVLLSLAIIAADVVFMPYLVQCGGVAQYLPLFLLPASLCLAAGILLKVGSRLAA